MKFKKGRRPGGRALMFGAVALVWTGALLAGAVPAWQKALRQHREVRQVEATLDDLDRWSVAGLWLERTLAPRREAVTPVWDRLFPAERRCEGLFLDLARVADESGVTQFELHELRSDELEAETLGVADPEPSAALGGYRVRALFDGDFEGVAGFLGGLGRLERAVAVHNLEIKPANGAVHVELELDVYVASTTES